MDRPKLSVVISLTGDGAALAGCLRSLRLQRDPPRLEVLVPLAAANRDRVSRQGTHPDLRFVEVPLKDGATPAGVGGRHLVVDRCRAAGLAAARGAIVALTDEHARPEAHWCARLIHAHRQPHAAIGGAIANANPRPLNWALYFCDAGRYQNPLPEGASRYVSDVNVSYKRSALQAVAPVWREVYQETTLHDALRARGETLWLRPDLLVHVDRGRLRWTEAVRERFAWARLYAARRTADVAAHRRILLALLAPGLACVLPVRQAKLALTRGRHRGGFVRALPWLVLMDGIWAIGELVGYSTARPTRVRRP